MRAFLAFRGAVLGLVLTIMITAQGFAQSSATSEAAEVFSPDAEATAEEWLKRLNDLVDLFEKHKDQATVPEHIYQSNDLKILAAYAWLVDTDEVGGDLKLLLSRIIQVASSSNNERFIKFANSFARHEHAALLGANFDPKQFELSISDPDWLIALPAMKQDFHEGVKSHLIPDKSYILQAALLEPSLNDPLRDLYELFYAGILSVESSYTLDAEFSYTNLIKTVFHLEEIGLPPLYVNGLLNLSASVQSKIPRSDLIEVFSRLAKIEFSDANLNQHTSVLLYYNFYHYNLERGGGIDGRELLKRLNSFDNKSEFTRFWVARYNLEFSMLNQTPDQIKANLGVYLNGNETLKELRFAPIWARYKTGEIDFETAYLQSYKLSIRHSLNLRGVFGRQKIARPNEYVLDNGSFIRRTSADSFNLNNSTNRKLPNSSLQVLRKTTLLLRSNFSLSDKPDLGAENHFIDHLLGFVQRPKSADDFYNDRMAWSDLDFESDLKQNKNSLVQLQQAPLFLSVLKREPLEQNPIFLRSHHRANSINHSQLLKAVDDIYSRRLKHAWTNILDIRSAVHSEDRESLNFKYDLGSVETLLYFLEGNSLNLIDHIGRQADQAIALNRELDINLMLLMVAITLEGEGYYQDAASTLEMVDIDDGGSLDLIAIRKWVMAKARMGEGKIEEAIELFDVALAPSVSSGISSHILLARLRAANIQKNIADIKKYRREILSVVPNENPDRFLETIRPEILHARYLIAQHNGDADAESIRQDYAIAQQQLEQSEYALRDLIASSRQQAQIKATADALSGLESERLVTSAQSRMTKYLLALAGLLSLVGVGAFLFAYREKSNVIKLNAKLDSRGRVFNRNYRDSLVDTQRFVRKISNSLEKVNENTDDVVLSTRLQTILEDLRDHETEQTQRSLERRSSSSENSIVNEFIPLERFARDMKRYWDIQSSPNDVSIHFRIADKLPVVSTDIQYIEYALKEAIQASIDHTDYGFISIDFSYDDLTETLKISVSDTGNGLQQPEVHYSGGMDAIKRLGGTTSFEKKPECRWTAEYRIPAPPVLNFQSLDENSNIVRLEIVNDR